LVVNGTLVTTYIADFSYREKGIFTVEDSKGMPTPAYVIKKKLLKAVHGIAVKET
jgi:Protein of unknown function (DUF1064)